MHSAPPPVASPLDPATRQLVRVAAVVAGGTEAAIRTELAAAPPLVPTDWTEELLLQTYLFAGFPRALNAMREWRRLVPLPPEAAGPQADASHYAHAPTWEVRGEATCAQVYGSMYDRLRENIVALHPALDQWMIVDGYGKILARPALDLARRELCIVAACAATWQERQLLSHLHGALHAGAPAGAVDDTVSAIAPLLPEEARRGAPLLWARVRGRSPSGPVS
jgi:4-carboxymuconolactone decarboxylase